MVLICVFICVCYGVRFGVDVLLMLFVAVFDMFCYIVAMVLLCFWCGFARVYFGVLSGFNLCFHMFLLCCSIWCCCVVVFGVKKLTRTSY